MLKYISSNKETGNESSDGVRHGKSLIIVSSFSINYKGFKKKCLSYIG